MLRALIFSSILASVATFFGVSAKTSTVTIRLAHTSDVHGNYYKTNYNDMSAARGGLARVESYAKEQRKQFGNRFILLDNGDILQGQPSAYYYNFMDTVSTHVVADIMNYMRYDVGNMGNHDVETGHAVYDRWIRQCNFPILGANTVVAATGKPYLKPYVILEREGVKIAVIGMITPAIPAWLAENLWSGLRFDDTKSSMTYWAKYVNETEKPDLTIAILHSGSELTKLGDYIENNSIEIAKTIPGIDIVMCGHDHRRNCEWYDNVDGHKSLVIDPASGANVVGEATVTFSLKNGKVVSKDIQAKLADVTGYEPDAEFCQRFAPKFDVVGEFVQEKVGEISNTIHSRDAFFGSAAFVDIIHKIQLDITKADISFSAPLAFDSSLKKGAITIADMFALMKYENMLYLMKLTGEEVKNHLEMSYELWTNQMQSADDHLLLLKPRSSGDYSKGVSFKNASYNFDSAAGIIYTVDVTKPAGSKVNIISMADGTPFDLNKTYKVAINSYRGNGGGELLTKGAGIPKAELKSRIIWSTDKDLRYYLIQYVKGSNEPISAQPLNNWHFVPENWAKPAAERDYKLLYSK